MSATRADGAAVVAFRCNGHPVRCANGTSVAAALLNAGITAFRTTSTGARRGPVCGMGTCYECRVTIDGEPHVRSCLVTAASGMDVRTNPGDAMDPDSGSVQ